MEPHQERVVAELYELSKKLEKLIEFFRSETFAALPKEDRFLLKNQAVLMEAYSLTLQERISRF